MHDRILSDGEIRKKTVHFLYCLLSWLPRQEGRRQAPLVTFVTANSCLLREDDNSFSLLLLSHLNKQKNTYARQDSIRRRSTKKDSTISVLSFVVSLLYEIAALHFISCSRFVSKRRCFSLKDDKSPTTLPDLCFTFIYI